LRKFAESRLQYDAPVRVLHIETGRQLLGGARQAGYLIKGLGTLGHENRLVCDPAHPLVAMVGSAACIGLACRGDLDFVFYRRLRRIIRAQAPDIVHVHSRRGADSFGGLAARAEGVPAILTRRVQSREPRGWIRTKCRSYRAIVAISSAVQQELVRAALPDSLLHRVVSAVDSDEFRPDPSRRAELRRRYDLAPDALVAGCAAQLIDRKGHAGLLTVTRELVEDYPSFRLLLFGDGPLRARLEQRVHALGLAPKVRFCGFTSDWPKLVPGLDLLLHPALREGLGAVILEAMSAGVAVAASAVGGIVDAIRDGVDGRLVPPGQSRAWIEAVRALLTDAPKRAALGAAARRSVEQRFTIGEMAARYQAIYEQVVV
jgi:glycosyltransferase involved in cell wall biosynthesis